MTKRTLSALYAPKHVVSQGSILDHMTLPQTPTRLGGDTPSPFPFPSSLGTFSTSNTNVSD